MDKGREWTLFSSYSTDHDAMKWGVSRDSEITPEVEKPERVKVIEMSAYTKLKSERDAAVRALEFLSDKEERNTYMENVRYARAVLAMIDKGEK